MPLAELQGGIIGAVELIECRRYADLGAFLVDQAAHYNEASWFEPPVLYGFVLAKPEVLPFHEYPGWFRFFLVSDAVPERKGKTPDLDQGNLFRDGQRTE